MAIYTRFGSNVEITSGDIDTGEVDIKYADGREGWAITQTFIYELKADDGIKEIYQAILELEK